MIIRTSTIETEGLMRCMLSNPTTRTGRFLGELGKAKESRLKEKARVVKMARAKAKEAVSRMARRGIALKE